MSEGYGEPSDYRIIFGGAGAAPVPVNPSRGDLTPTDMDYYTGGVPPLPTATPQMDGSTRAQVVQSDQADLSTQANQDAPGVQWGGNDILKDVTQGVGAVGQTVTDLSSLVMSAVRKVTGASSPTPTGTSSTGSMGSLFFPLALFGLGYLIFRKA